MPGTTCDGRSAPRRNLELKVAIPAYARDIVQRRLDALGTGPPACLHQVDHYFAVPEGRLKLRVIRHETGESRAELIAYHRPDTEASRWSAYRITPMSVEQGEHLRGTLRTVLPITVCVRKYREIRFYGATRIHLDDVDDLGTFVELETVVAGQGDAAATAEHRYVSVHLGLDHWPMHARSYSDLLRDHHSNHVAHNR